MSNREVMQQALEALTIYSDAQCSLKGQAAITALRAALEQQQAEPVQEQKYEKRIAPYSTTLSMLLNTAPPQQQAEPPPEWESIKNILDEYGLDAIAFVAAWKAVQQRAEPVQERITRIAWDERGVRTVNGIPDDAPQRPWLGLTDDEITEIRLKTFDAVATNHESYRAIEAKLKEKNDH